jgi:hypothetical protein
MPPGKKQAPGRAPMPPGKEPAGQALMPPGKEAPGRRDDANHGEMPDNPPPTTNSNPAHSTLTLGEMVTKNPPGRTIAARPRQPAGDFSSISPPSTFCFLSGLLGRVLVCSRGCWLVRLCTFITSSRVGRADYCDGVLSFMVVDK